ncbi:Imm21 family immunity protein [Micromonospora echinospora]|uniref:Imm21 family immunity protein n=1 Tax=Micromonospora echinospora TaxID=1877 RepID=UPI00379B2DAF
MDVQTSRGKTRWIESSGGPFVVLPASQRSVWSGGDGPDYDMACEVDDHLGLVQSAAQSEALALVVADEPLTSAFVDDIGAVLQWQYAPSDEALLSAARHSVESLDWVAGPTLDVPGELVMFDAVVPGNSLRPDETLLIALPPGRYRTATADFAVGADVCGRLHRFRGHEG